MEFFLQGPSEWYGTDSQSVKTVSGFDLQRMTLDFGKKALPNPISLFNQIEPD